VGDWVFQHMGELCGILVRISFGKPTPEKKCEAFFWVKYTGDVHCCTQFRTKLFDTQLARFHAD